MTKRPLKYRQLCAQRAKCEPRRGVGGLLAALFSRKSGAQVSGLHLVGFAAFLALCGLATPALAQRADLFVVSGVQVDERAANAADARAQAIIAGKIEAVQRMISRITLASERAARGEIAVDAALAQRLVAALEVADERSSSTRYLGNLTLTLDPSQIRALLRAKSYQFVENRGSPILIVPQVDANASVQSEPWRRAWGLGGFTHELRPLVLGDRINPAKDDWASVANDVQNELADSALFVRLSMTTLNRNTILSVHAKLVSATSETDLGEFMSQGLNLDGPAIQSRLLQITEQISDRVQEQWKRQSLDRSGTKASLTVTALYANQPELQRIRASLEKSRLLTGVRPRAIASDGALFELTFAGAEAQLRADLAKTGLVLEDQAIGPVIRLATP